MKEYYARITETPEKDLLRVSYHYTDYSSVEEALENLPGTTTDQYKKIDNQIVLELSGLCGYDLEGDTIKEALDNLEDINFDGSPWQCDPDEDFFLAIYEGEYSEGGAHENDDCPEGILFYPAKIAKIITANEYRENYS